MRRSEPWLQQLRSMRVRLGSTSFTLKVLAYLRRLAEECEDAREFAAEAEHLVKGSLGIRRSSALLANTVRLLLPAIAEKLDQAGSFKEARPDLISLIDEQMRRIVEATRRAAEIASRRIEDGDAVMTNTFSLTVLRTLEFCVREGKEVRVLVPESRPGLEGLRMAAALEALGIEVTLFVDSAVRYFMKEVDKVVVGAEAIAANGAVIAKVGTSQIALAAHEARVRVFVAACSLKLSPETVLGELLEIERGPVELLMTPEQAKELGAEIEVPLLDVTPPEYIDLVVTEFGVMSPQAIPAVMRELYGWPSAVISVEDALARLKSAALRSPAR